MRFERAHRSFWNSYARCYDGLLDFIPYRRLLQLAVDRIALEPGQRMADLGCGTGNTINVLSAEVPTASFTGIDSSSSMLKVARRKLAGRHTVRLVESDLLVWLSRAQSDSLDRIVSVNVLYTMQPEARELFWTEALRALTPDGRMVVVTTDRAGVGPVIREHTAERSFLSSLTPRLAAVIVMNLVIWLLESRKVFDPASAETLSEECARAGGSVVAMERCYGGEVDGVDVLLVIEPVVDLSDPSSTEGVSPQDSAADPVRRTESVQQDGYRSV